MKLIQVSDLHFVPPGTLLLGLDPRARLAACIADINAHHGDAELCLFTGDLVDRGEPEAYAALRAVLAELDLPYRLLIGNHDDRAAFRRSFPEVPCDDHGFVQSRARVSAGDLLLLDSHEPGADWGRFCSARAEWLRARLAEAEGRPVYLFLHHPPFDIGIPSLDAIRLRDPGPLIAAIEGAGADIRHLFFGHVHRPVSGAWRGIPVSALPSTVHQVPLDTMTAAPVPSDHGPPAYAVIMVEAERHLVHLHAYLDDNRLPPGIDRYSST